MKKSILKQTKTSTAAFFLKLFLGYLILATAACNNNDQLNLDLNLNEFPSDTFLLKQIQIETVKEAYQRTDNINFQLLGALHDSVFGPMRSSIFTQVGLNGSVSIPTNAEVDSVTIDLAFIDYYGNLSQGQDIGVYLLADSIDASKNYYNNDSITLGKKIGFRKNFKLAINNGVLHVNITDMWGSNGLKPGSSYTKDKFFLRQCYGIALVPESQFKENEGLICYFNLVSNSSFIKAYYHYFTRDGDLLERQNGTAELQFRTNVTSFSHLRHNYKNTAIESAVNADSTNAYRGFLQAIGGTYVSIKIPELKNLTDSPLFAFHKAELILPCDEKYHNYSFKPIPFLDIKVVDADGQLYDVADQSKVYWVRSYNPIEKAFVFNLTSHVQGIFNSYKRNPDFVDYGLVIKAVKNEPIPFSAGRFVVKGASAKRPNGAYLRVFYSKIDRP